jgi:hypothetical protein
MTAMDLCPEEYKEAEKCNKRFCSYRNKLGKCSLDIELLPQEYEIGVIADILQTSRQRVWRIYDVAIAKLQIKLSNKSS